MAAEWVLWVGATWKCLWFLRVDFEESLKCELNNEKYLKTGSLMSKVSSI